MNKTNLKYKKILTFYKASCSFEVLIALESHISAIKKNQKVPRPLSRVESDMIVSRVYPGIRFTNKESSKSSLPFRMR